MPAATYCGRQSGLRSIERSLDDLPTADSAVRLSSNGRGRLPVEEPVLWHWPRTRLHPRRHSPRLLREPYKIRKQQALKKLEHERSDVDAYPFRSIANVTGYRPLTTHTDASYQASSTPALYRAQLAWSLHGFDRDAAGTTVHD